MQIRPQPGMVPSPPSAPDWSRRAFLQCSTAALAGFALRRSAAATGARQGWLAQPVEVDPESGAEIFQLTDGPRPTDNIYGEQPYNSRQGDRIAVRHYEAAGMDGGLSILDLTDGALYPVLTTAPRFPAFHAWGEHLYYQEMAGERLILKRCHYLTLAVDEVIDLPTQEGDFSYGTVSPDLRYYAAAVQPPQGGSKVLLVDLSTGQRRTLLQRTEYHFKHEQFSLDGRNRVLIQANRMPDVRQVHLGTLQVDREGVRWFPADRPHTPRPTGHEAWVGPSERILFSTAVEPGSQGNIWIAGLDDPAPRLASVTPNRFSHVSVSRCGKFWIGDATNEAGIPIHLGSLRSGKHRRLVFSRTKHDGKQWSHTHPYLTADNRWLIFTSTRHGRPQVYGARIPETFFQEL